MADLFLDIRDRQVRALVTDGEDVRLRHSSALAALAADGSRETGRHEAQADRFQAGELSALISLIKAEGGTALDRGHLIIPPAYVIRSTHKLPRLPQSEALKLITRKVAAESREDEPQVQIIPMDLEQNSQTWLAEYVPTDTLRFLKKEFGSLRLRSVTTATQSILQAIEPIREAIFNAHAIFEVNAGTIDAYYVSNSSLLLHESLSIPADDDERQTNQDESRSQKRRIFSILDLLYRVNSQYLAANPMTPLQKVWLCGSDPAIPELSSTLMDAMDVEVAILCEQVGETAETCAFVTLKGFVRSQQKGTCANFMHPDLARRFPLRKKTGLFIYLATLIMAIALVWQTELRISRLKKQVAAAKKNQAQQKGQAAAAAAIAKNLENLRQLTGNQVTFYPILRELAMNLPDGVDLEGLAYSRKEALGQLEISASFPHSGDLGTSRIISRLMAVMDNSPFLARHQEPQISITASGTQKRVAVKFICEVRPHDQAK